jgi:hypothetical protein
LTNNSKMNISNSSFSNLEKNLTNFSIINVLNSSTNLSKNLTNASILNYSNSSIILS